MRDAGEREETERERDTERETGKGREGGREGGRERERGREGERERRKRKGINIVIKDIYTCTYMYINSINSLLHSQSLAGLSANYT